MKKMIECNSSSRRIGHYVKCFLFAWMNKFSTSSLGWPSSRITFQNRRLVSSASSSFSDFHSTPLRSFTCADHPCRNPDLQRAKNPPPETVSEIENSSLPTSLLTGPNQKMSLDGILFFLAIFERFFQRWDFAGKDLLKKAPRGRKFKSFSGKCLLYYGRGKLLSEFIDIFSNVEQAN